MEINGSRGHTFWLHNINLGDTDGPTIMWDEAFDPETRHLLFGGITDEEIKVMTVVGTRPEIIRLSAVINKLMNQKQ